MTLSPATRDAVLEVVKRLRDPMLDVHVDSIGSMLRHTVLARTAQGRTVVDDVRTALHLQPVIGSLAHWARGKSREEVAKALEKIATPVHEPR